MTNVAVVVLDTLRYDYFKQYFDWLDGRRFTNAYSTSHWTIPAHASLFTGLYPSEVGTHAKSPSLECDTSVLAERLRETGYQTRFFSANGNITAWPGWERGFAQFLKPRELNPRFENTVDWDELEAQLDASGWRKYLGSALHCVTADEPTIRNLRHGYHRLRKSNADGGGEDILARLRETDFQSYGELLVINLMETHTPYHPPPESDNPVRISVGQAFADSVDDPDRIRSTYDHSVQYLSRVYREIHRLLQEDFEYVVTLSDHGEMLGEQGLWNHGYGLFPELTRIPIVISGPSIAEETRLDPVSILDVHATIGSLAGVDVGGRGRDLLDDNFEASNRLVEYHGFMDSHRGQFEREGVSLETYDERDGSLSGLVTSSGQYGYQTHSDGVQFTDEVIDEFEEKMSEERESLNEVTRREVEMDDSIKQQLKDLGYA